MIGDGDAIARLQAELEAAQAELREWREAHERLADGSQHIVSRIDASGRVTYVSPSVRKILGYEPADLVGRVGFDFIDPGEQAERRAGFAEGLRQKLAPTVTARVRRKDGTYVWMEYRTDVLRDERGHVTGFQSTSFDVTSRHEAEEALRRSEENFETFVRTMPVPAVMHRDTKFLLVNRAFTEVFGYAEADLLSRSIFDVVDGKDKPYVQQVVRGSPQERAGTRTREHHLVHADGTLIAVEVTSVSVIFRGELSPMAVIHDLRERKRLEAQLVTADRLASLGRLSAAVGHEINNPLAYVLASLGLIDREIAQLGVEPERVRQLHELLANVKEGAERIRDVVRDLKALSREQADAPVPVDLGQVLDACTALADHEVRHRARLVKDYADLPLVLGTEARLGQVFLNLLVNAAQAIPDGDVDANEVRVEAREAPEGVVVDIVDTGVGIEPETAGRIFEPFFSTKPGGGIGLGLSICQQIVASLGGSISATANAPRGSRFRVRLPRADGPARADESRVGSVVGAKPEPADARFLIVDDEPQLARMIARLLRPRPVDVAFGGKEAIELLAGGRRYDVILCDLHMSDLSGMDVYEHAQRAGEGLERRMIFMTGGVVSPRAIEFVASCDCPVLDKPFDAATLESAIAAVLRR